jgi:hypothetical protein
VDAFIKHDGDRRRRSAGGPDGGAFACLSASPNLPEVWHGKGLRGPAMQSAAIGKAMHKGLLKIYFLYATGAKMSRSARPIYFFRDKIVLDTVLLEKGGLYLRSVWR